MNLFSNPEFLRVYMPVIVQHVLLLMLIALVAGKFIKENGRENITDIALDEKIPTLNHEFCSCEDMINLSDKIVSYIKENSEYFGD